MIHTIIALEDVFGQNYQSPRDMEKRGTAAELAGICSRAGGEMTRRTFSTNPRDFLDNKFN